MAGVVDTATLGTEDYPYAAYRQIFSTARMAMSLVSVRPAPRFPRTSITTKSKSTTSCGATAR